MMKKLMITLCALILGAGQLYSVESNKFYVTTAQNINIALSKSNNVDDAIRNLKTLAIDNKELSNILAMRNKQGFWKLVSLLAEKYPNTRISDNIEKQYYLLSPSAQYGNDMVNHHEETLTRLTIAQKLKPNIKEEDFPADIQTRLFFQENPYKY